MDNGTSARDGRGSPPQVRGKRKPQWCCPPRSRITPAGAGKTHTPAQVALKNEDHPRRCGENRNVSVSVDKAAGSPPQVRGKPAGCPWRVSRAGITPAGAGKTGLRFAKPTTTWDHPRRCGENRIYCSTVCSKQGSPPQVRGKPHSLQEIARAARITPAGAGKTLNNAVCARDCGGSPPQVRGKRLSTEMKGCR